jgi:hypothetical protein
MWQSFEEQQCITYLLHPCQTSPPNLHKISLSNTHLLCMQHCIQMTILLLSSPVKILTSWNALKPYCTQILHCCAIQLVLSISSLNLMSFHEPLLLASAYVLPHTGGYHRSPHGFLALISVVINFFLHCQYQRGGASFGIHSVRQHAMVNWT